MLGKAFSGFVGAFESGIKGIGQDIRKGNILRAGTNLLTAGATGNTMMPLIGMDYQSKDMKKKMEGDAARKKQEQDNIMSGAKSQLGNIDLLSVNRNNQMSKRNFEILSQMKDSNVQRLLNLFEQRQSEIMQRSLLTSTR